MANFTTQYYKPNLPSNHNPLPRYNVDENESTLSLFHGQLGSASASTVKILTNNEWRSIMLYLFNNLTEVQPFIGEFVRESWNEPRDDGDVVQNAKDIQMLERLLVAGDEDEDDDVGPSDSVAYLDNIDSDDETCNPNHEDYS